MSAFLTQISLPARKVGNLFLTLLFVGLLGSLAAQPANDNCASAVTLTPGASCVTTAGTTVAATQSIAAISCAGFTATTALDVWYQFTATAANLNVTVVGDVNFDAVIDVRSGACDGTNIACADATLSGGTEVAALTGLTVGNIYLVRVYDFSGTATFTICVATPPAAPANDNCAGAIAFPTILNDGNCGTVTVNTAAATGAADATCTGTEDDDVWYTFTTPAGVTSLLYTNTTLSGSTDRVLQIYSGTCAGLTSLGCYDPESGTITGLTGSTTYYLRAYTWSSGVTSNFTLCLRTPPPPPANDNCAGAISVPVNAPGTCTTQPAGTVAGATASSGAPTVCTGTADDDVWFSFVATTTSVTVALNNVTGSTTDLVHQVVSGACGSQVQVSCSDPNSSTVTGLTIGQTYYLRVFTWTSTGGQTSAFNVCVSEVPPPPANDACAGAITISGCSSVTGTTIGATGDALTSSCSSVSVSSTSQGVWYRFVGDGNPAEVNTCSPGTNFDTKIHVYSGSCGTFTCVGGNDDSSPVDPACDLSGLNRKSKVNWTTTAGVVYYIYVYPFTNPGGNFTLNLISGPPCVAPAPSPTNITTTTAAISWAAVSGAVSYSYSFGTAGHVCGTGAVTQAGTSANLTGLTPNTTYTFCARTICACGSSAYTSITFTTLPLPNDNCAGAQTITCGQTVTGNTAGAASDSGLGSCGSGGTPGNGIWYKLVGNGAQATVSLCGSSYDTKLHVYSGSCGSLVCVGSNDDFCGSQSQVVFNATVGTDYYILVSGFGSATGAFTMSISCICGPALGAPWTVTNIGASNGGAIDNVCDGTIDIKATNYGSLTSDVQTFAWQTMCGDGFIKAKLVNVTNGGWGGVMFRENNAQGSKKITLRSQLTSSVVRDLRATTNGVAQQQQFPKPNSPQWLRLTRTGNVFVGETSLDGVNWDFTFSTTLVLPSCIEVGLFSQGINVNTTSTAIFNNIMGVQTTLPPVPLADAGNQGVEESIRFGLFPNPAQNEVGVKLESFIGKKVNLTVYNNLGQAVLVRDIDEVLDMVETLSIADLSNGVYFVTLRSEGLPTQTEKLIVGAVRP